MDPNGKAAKALMWLLFGIVLAYIFLLMMMDAMKPA